MNLISVDGRERVGERVTKMDLDIAMCRPMGKNIKAKWEKRKGCSNNEECLERSIRGKNINMKGLRYWCI